VTLLLVVIALSVAAVSAVTDARSGRIPNAVTLPALAAAPLLRWSFGGAGEAAAAVLGAVVCGVGPFLMFRRGAMGGGDVKLFAALGALLGARRGLEMELVSLLFALVYALCLLAWRGRLLATLGGTFRIVQNAVLPAARRRELRPELSSTIRLGVPVFLAALWCLAGPGLIGLP
jgi:prepilin peptidase CpaA